MLDGIIVLGTYFVQLLKEVIRPIGGVLLRLMQSQEMVGRDYVVVVGWLDPREQPKHSCCLL